MRYLIPHAKAAYAQIGRDPVDGVEHLWRWIRDRGVKQISERELHHGTKGRLKHKKDLEPALECLLSRGYLRALPTARREARGRPQAPMYEVNPLACEAPAGVTEPRETPTPIFEDYENIEDGIHVDIPEWNEDPFAEKFATELARDGVGLATIATLGGWKEPQTILRHYMKTDEETMREALERRKQQAIG